jgi:hypothetical protein
MRELTSPSEPGVTISLGRRSGGCKFRRLVAAGSGHGYCRPSRESIWRYPSTAGLRFRVHGYLRIPRYAQSFDSRSTRVRPGSCRPGRAVHPCCRVRRPFDKGRRVHVPVRGGGQQTGRRIRPCALTSTSVGTMTSLRVTNRDVTGGAVERLRRRRPSQDRRRGQLRWPVRRRASRS